MKTLISWVAQNNDFEHGKVNESGPNVTFHKYFFKGDRHFILSTKKQDDTRTELLVNHLSRAYPDRKIEAVYLDITDPIDHQEIQSKITPFLANFKDDQIALFISPGTNRSPRDPIEDHPFFSKFQG